MAHQAMGRALWNRRNKQEQGLLISHPRYSDILNNKRPSLVSTVQPASLWPHLRRYKTVGESVQDKMTLNSTRSETVEKLLDHVERGPTWQLHSFLRSCNLTDQDHIIREVGLDPEMYDGPSPPESDSEDDSDPAVDDGVQEASPSVPNTSDGATSAKQPHVTTSHQSLAIQYHRDVYNRTLMRGRLFNIPSLDLPYDMEWCYMQVVATSNELLQNPVDILPADILKAKPGKPKLKTVLLSGHPGTGKSSFIRFYGHKWTQMKAGESEWDLIVILDVSTLKLTEGLSTREHIKEAIKQSLKGRGDKEAIMKSVDDDSLNILIIPDGMDECRSNTILDMLRELMFSCYNGELGFTVLATCRTGLCPIMESLFDRRLKIDGFKTHEGVEYVQRFYEHIQAPDDDTVYEYIANNQEDLNHILTNPLCTHILSVVTADGTLKLTKGQRLRLKDLFMAMEKSMKRRQLEKLMQDNSGNLANSEQLEDEIKYFYNMSLWALLQDVRTFDEDIMGKFGINAQHPYLTFMTKTKKYDSDLQDVSYWRFNHEMFHEYFAASALEALPDEMCWALLLTISSDTKFRNTQRILFSALGEDIAQLPKLTDMIRLNILTNADTDGSDTVTKAIADDITEKCKTCLDLVDILNMLKPGKTVTMDTSYAKEVWQTVRSLYEDPLKVLSTGLFTKYFHNPLHRIYECLHELPEEHQKLVFADSLGCALPSVCMNVDGSRDIVYKTGGTRWVKITENVLDVEVSSQYSLTDASEAVQQYGKQHLATWMKDKGTRQIDKICINLGDVMTDRTYLAVGGLFPSDIWGSCYNDQVLSTTVWSDLLSDISNWSVSANTLYLPFEQDMHAIGFLQCLQMERTQESLMRMLVQDEGGRLRIEVRWGVIDIGNLLLWTDWYLQQDLLQVYLENLYCRTVSDSNCKQDLERRVEALEVLEHNGCRVLKLFRDSYTHFWPPLTRIESDAKASDLTDYKEVGSESDGEVSEMTDYEDVGPESADHSNQACCSSCTLI